MQNTNTLIAHTATNTATLQVAVNVDDLLCFELYKFINWLLANVNNKTEWYNTDAIVDVLNELHDDDWAQHKNADTAMGRNLTMQAIDAYAEEDTSGAYFYALQALIERTYVLDLLA
jgi:hypothetical protein